MAQLPTLIKLLPKIENLGKSIKLALYRIEIKPKNDDAIPIPFTDFIIRFHKDQNTDIYVTGHILNIPVMSVEKLHGLQNFFTSINCPYTFEHEACHLLDVQQMKVETIEMTEQQLEYRANAIEQALGEKYGTIISKQ